MSPSIVGAAFPVGNQAMLALASKYYKLWGCSDCKCCLHCALLALTCADIIAGQWLDIDR